jgi:hypothetical protein
LSPADARQELPHCDELFARFFKPWYSERDLKRRVYPATRPDLEVVYRPGISATDVSPLVREGRERVQEAIGGMVEAVRCDWPEAFGVSEPLSLEWVAAFDGCHDRQEISRLIAESDPSDFANPYLVWCCEFGVAMGEVFLRLNPELEWLYDWPYWESAIFDSTIGARINVFHWAIKKMSEYGVDDGFAAKIMACLQDLKRRSRRRKEERTGDSPS